MYFRISIFFREKQNREQNKNFPKNKNSETRKDFRVFES